ncbi:hypothetical protein GCM10023142_34960 [Anaerocolumna aminovalerica]
MRSPIIEHSNKYLYDEEAVLTVGDGVGTGKVFHYVNGKYDLHQRVYRMFDFTKDITGKYFYYYFSNHFYNRVMSMTAKTSVDSVRFEMISGMDILLPSKKEQMVITSFFDSLNNLITLHQRKLDRLKQLKQGYLQQMFPRDGESVPRLRFANFHGKWEQRKLGAICKVNSGRDYKHLNEGNIPVYGTGGYMLSVDDKLSDVDGIGIGRKGTIDKPQYLKAPFWTVDTLFYMTSLPNNDLKFLFSLSQNIRWKRMDESTGVPSLSKTSIEKIACSFPCFEEQQKIGSFFEQMDEIITFQQTQLDKLKLLKKSYLQKMFT